MNDTKELAGTHPEGEPESTEIQPVESLEPTSVDTFAGKVHVKWVADGAVSSFGLMAYFIEFLKVSGKFDEWVKDSPLQYSSSNAPQKRDVLGTILLSVLAGQWRYAHISAIRSDGVNPELLGMTKVVSEDSARRALAGLKEEESGVWMKRHLKASYEPLLEEPWVLDVDTTVKQLYGHQEDAKAGYNPSKPGRPSHAYHSYFIGNLRLVLDVEVQAGNQTASSFAQPELWSMLEGLTEKRHPVFLRGDCNWGTERLMVGAEQRKIPYLLKLKQSSKVKKLIGKLMGKEEWEEVGQQWEGVATQLQLSGWSQTRRVVVLRRPLRKTAEPEGGDKKRSRRNNAKQLTLDLPEFGYQGVIYEYAVLVTSLSDEVRAITQHYRDRGDSENNFDELKNQWGWGGFTTQDRNRCQIMARIGAMIHNWWAIFMRLGSPDKHAEAITSRPLALHGIARLTRHSNQTTVEVTSTHAKAPKIAAVLTKVSAFLKRVKAVAEQLTQYERWRLILSVAFRAFLGGKLIGSPGRLSDTAA